MQLKAWREKNGLSLTRLADLTGLAHSTLSLIERGKRNCGRSAAKRIEAATNGEVTAAELLGLNADEPRSDQAVRETGRALDAAPVSVAVPADLAEMARAYGLNVEALLADGGIPRLREAFKAAYVERHRDAIDEINTSVREHGTLSERFGTI